MTPLNNLTLCLTLFLFSSTQFDIAQGTLDVYDALSRSFELWNRAGNGAVGENLFRILGGVAMNRPCCTSAGDSVVHCFVRNPDSYVSHLTVNKDGETNWTAIETQTILGEIECLSSGADGLMLMALDLYASLITNRKEDKWEGWVWRGGILAESPSCVAHDDEIDCVHRRHNNSAYVTNKIEDEWEWNHYIGGVFTSPLKCISIEETRIDCFGAAAPRRLLKHGRNDITKDYFVMKWEGRGGYAVGRPSVTSWGPDRIDVFYLGEDSTAKHIYYDGEWRPEEMLDSSMRFDAPPECVATGVGRMHCFAIGEASALYRTSFDGSAWSNWTTEFGTFMETPSCVVPVKGEDVVLCYMRSFKLHIVEKRFEF